LPIPGTSINHSGESSITAIVSVPNTETIRSTFFAFVVALCYCHTKIPFTPLLYSIEVIKENSYRLADDILGIGFKTADSIASKLGFGKDDYVRCRSGLMDCLCGIVTTLLSV